MIGGTKNIKPEVIRALKPDILIANKEENIKEQVEAAGRDCEVILTEVGTYTDALAMIERLGERTQTQVAARRLIAEIATEKQQLDTLVSELSHLPRVLYLIWHEPYMTIGGDTFIHAMLELAGFINVFGEKARYPAISVEEIDALRPELIFLSSEPYPFKSKHLAQLQLICPTARVLLVDGQAFSWYGSRMKHALAYFRALHNEIAQSV
jgi:ABC-type Fe3+-hydroxamate transport system substrate-binding protein